MSIPDYESIMLPVLQFIKDGNVYKTRSIVEYIIELFKISPEEAKELIPSGRAKLIDNRVGWACTHLRKAGLIDSPQRGLNQITEEGKMVVTSSTDKVTAKYLAQFSKYNDFKKIENKEISKEEENDRTPEEIIGIQNEILRSSLKFDLLDFLGKVDPARFEQIIIDLLIAMGYGGTVEDAGEAIGQTNDGGIDGVIKEDVLGLDAIFIQAKRWQNTVPIKEIRDFAGALLSKKSTKGIFIATSSFPESAYEFVNNIERKIILIDGNRLAELMIKYNIGVTKKDVIEIKEIDGDYFLA